MTHVVSQELINGGLVLCTSRWCREIVVGFARQQRFNIPGVVLMELNVDPTNPLMVHLSNVGFYSRNVQAEFVIQGKNALEKLRHLQVQAHQVWAHWLTFYFAVALNCEPRIVQSLAMGTRLPRRQPNWNTVVGNLSWLSCPCNTDRPCTHEKE